MNGRGAASERLNRRKNFRVAKATLIMIRDDTGEATGRTFRIPRVRSLLACHAIRSKDVSRDKSYRQEIPNQIEASRDFN